MNWTTYKVEHSIICGRARPFLHKSFCCQCTRQSFAALLLFLYLFEKILFFFRFFLLRKPANTLWVLSLSQQQQQQQPKRPAIRLIIFLCELMIYTGRYLKTPQIRSKELNNCSFFLRMLLLLFSDLCSAQEKERHDKIRAKKIANFIQWVFPGL